MTSLNTILAEGKQKPIKALVRNDYLKEMEKMIRHLSPRHSLYNVFSDFVAMAAISISNAVDKSYYDEREGRYFDTMKRYRKEETEKFPQLLSLLTLALEQEFGDVLGELYHALGIHNEQAGQFFTPYSVCKMMALMTIPDDLQEHIDQKGYLTLCEPACGGGAMVIACADAMRANGVNYQRHLHVTAVDIDITAIHMAYVQLSLLHVPAVVVHGDTLMMQEFSHWHTPAHILGFWDSKLRTSKPASQRSTIPAVPPAPVAVPEPEPTAPMTQLSLF